MKHYVVWLVLLSCFSAEAHEFIVKPERSELKPAEKLNAEIMVTEVYMQPDRLPPIDTELYLIADQQQKLALTADKEANVYRASTAAPEGAFLLQAHSVRFKAVDRDAPEKGQVKMESFSKAAINVNSNPDVLLTRTQSRLEVVALKSLQSLKKGEPLPIVVLFDGQPVQSRVQATYDGYSDEEHGYTQKGMTDENGRAEIALSDAGLWLVRAKLKITKSEPDYEIYEVSANLIFQTP